MPGGQYAHLLDKAGNDWQPASVTGFFDVNGWGHSVGYPALLLHPQGTTITGMLLTSRTLQTLWSELDEFEGAAYLRRQATVTCKDGSQTTAAVYELHPDLHAAVLAQLGITRR